MNCPNCGVALAGFSSTCPACGAPLPQTHVAQPPEPPKDKEPKDKEPKDKEPKDKEPKDEKPAWPLLPKLRISVITWVIVFALGFVAEKAVDFAFKDGPMKLAEENQRVGEALARMHPEQVALNFYGRLIEPRGWVIYQWNAPFNAAEAERRLDAKYQRQAAQDHDVFPYVPGSTADQPAPLGLTWEAQLLSHSATPSPLQAALTPGETHPIARRIDTHWLDKDFSGILKKKIGGFQEEDALEKALAAMPLPSPVQAAPTPDPEQAARLARQQKRQAAYEAEQKQISHYALPADLQFGKNGIVSVFVSGALGLLDAYLFALRVFLPNTPLVVLMALITVGVALLASVHHRLDKDADLRSLFLLLLLLPFGISALGWLLWELGEGMTLAFRHVLTAPMLNAVGTSAATPVVAWFSGKAAEHSLVERTLERDAVRRLMGLAGKLE